VDARIALSRTSWSVRGINGSRSPPDEACGPADRCKVAGHIIVQKRREDALPDLRRQAQRF